ncbi:MAG: YggS family pyridoxal phosphate-dependent enzyme [Bacteroidota bacterium]
MVTENIKNIRENIQKTCFRIGRNPDSVELIAVSKTFSAELIKEAIEIPVYAFGENYVQELVQKRKKLEKYPIQWHMIGHLQTNKVKYIAEWIHLIQSVDNESVAEEIQKRGEKASRMIDVLVEVNTSEEATKFGVTPDRAVDLMKIVSHYPNIRLKGLMTIGPFSDDATQSRKSFSLLRTIFNKANALDFLKMPLTVLSMGMTHDYIIAIEEGSTMVRIGTAIFGSRTQQQEER